MQELFNTCNLHATVNTILKPTWNDDTAIFIPRNRHYQHTRTQIHLPKRFQSCGPFHFFISQVVAPGQPSWPPNIFVRFIDTDVCYWIRLPIPAQVGVLCLLSGRHQLEEPFRVDQNTSWFSLGLLAQYLSSWRGNFKENYRGVSSDWLWNNWVTGFLGNNEKR